VQPLKAQLSGAIAQHGVENLAQVVLGFGTCTLMRVRFHKDARGQRTVIVHQFSATDRQIDELVYELYGLTEDNKAIVEARDEAQNIEEVNARAQ